MNEDNLTLNNPASKRWIPFVVRKHQLLSPLHNNNIPGEIPQMGRGRIDTTSWR